MGMVGLALLLLVREQGGGYAAAGAVSGAYFVATAIGAPIAGRLVDRTRAGADPPPARRDLPRASRRRLRAGAARGSARAHRRLCSGCGRADAPCRLVAARSLAADVLRRRVARRRLRARGLVAGDHLHRRASARRAADRSRLTGARARRRGGGGSDRNDADRALGARARLAAGRGAARVDPGGARVARCRDDRRPLRLSRPGLRRHRGRVSRLRRGSRRRRARQHPAVAVRGRQPRRRARRRRAGDDGTDPAASRLHGRCSRSVSRCRCSAGRCRAWRCSRSSPACRSRPSSCPRTASIDSVARPGTAAEAFAWITTAVFAGFSVGMALGGTLIDAFGVKSSFALGAAAVAFGVLLVAFGPGLEES